MFGKIGNMPKITSDNDKLILERFVVISYDQSSAGEMVNEARSDIIAHRQKPYEINTYCISTVGTCNKGDVPSRLDVGLVSYLLTSTFKP